MNGISPPFWKPMTGTHSESDSSAESPKVSRNRDGISEKWDISKMLRKIACDCHPKKYILKSSHSSKVFRNSIFSRISSPKRLEQSSNKVLPVKLWKSSLFRSPSPNMKTFPGFLHYLRNSPNHEVEALFSSESSEEYEVHRRKEEFYFPYILWFFENKQVFMCNYAFR